MAILTAGRPKLLIGRRTDRFEALASCGMEIGGWVRSVDTIYRLEIPTRGLTRYRLAMS